jgi:hypothetical protein
VQQQLHFATKEKGRQAMSDTTTRKIAELNDLCRTAMGVAGRLVQTAGINALPLFDQSAIREKVETFNAFTPDNRQRPSRRAGFRRVHPQGRKDFLEDRIPVRVLLMLAGAVTLYCYGLILNLAPLDWGRLMGAYVATFFVVGQVINLVVFRTAPTLPIVVGGLFILMGGAITTLWQR